MSTKVAILFNRSFCKGLVPAKWKEAIVTPFLKKGSKADLSNYCPISLLPILSKVQKRLVFNKLYPFFSSYYVIVGLFSGGVMVHT